VRGSGNRAFVPHRTHHVVLRECIAYRTIGSAFWWDATERSDDLAYERCVAATTSVPPGADEHHSVTGFSLGQTAQASVIDCVAVGTAGGLTSSGFLWPEQTNTSPGEWASTGCVSHNNQANGFHLWTNRATGQTLANMVGYHNGQTSIDHGAYISATRFVGAHLVGDGGGGGSPTSADTARAVPVVLHAVAAGTRPVDLYVDCTLDAAGAARTVIRRLPGAGKPLTPARFVRCALLGHTGRAAIEIVEGGGSGFGVYDFVACRVGPDGRDLEPTDVQILSANPGFRLRVQSIDGRRAWALDHRGNVTTTRTFA
jgi:hypothetical protein